ncbi:recombinase family protein [Guptibacillus hwajinpoensis]|uniref:recombinase family protein n=1 Tax=Guptibacillus hwajinpoensis TaxID=208199 RepID=UPI001CFD7BA3|nr:recombinase family protein [Pseudalkalibacillus hwajinpoensis]WLR60631.1 recombinase family protein [Pseudalkalibacillus hwajinpoensis]
MNLANLLKPGSVGVFYGRHSTDKQNMETQLRNAYEFVCKYDCIIEKEYLDSAISSRKKDRQQLQNLLSDANKNQFDFIVIYDHSRLARIPEDHDMLRLTLSILKIPIFESSTETLYDSGDLILAAVKDGVAKYELDKISINTKQSMETLVANGYWTGGTAPFGYAYHTKGSEKNRQFEQVEHEVILVKKVFKLYLEHHGFASIAKQLPSKSHRGSDWTKDKVKNVITNPFYAGYIAIRRKDPGRHNAVRERKDWKMKESPFIVPVIQKSEWEYCWDLYSNKKKGMRNPKKFKTSYLVNGLLKCRKCNSYLKNKDQRTTSNQGRVYGERVYYCKHCSYKLRADDVHEKTIGIFKTSFTLEKDKIIENIKMITKNKIEEEKKKLKELEESLRKEKIKLFQCNQQLEELFKDEESYRDLIKIFILIKENIQESIHLIDESNDEIIRNIDTLEEVYLDNAIISFGLEALKNVSKQVQVNIRRLFLSLVDEIVIDEEGYIEVKLKYNLGSTER